MSGSGLDLDAGLDLDDEHEEGNHEAWVIPYADMLTLLMALFLMLFAISSVDLAKFRELAGSLSDQFGDGTAATEPLDGEVPVLDPDVATEDVVDRAQKAELALRREEAAAVAAEADRAQLDAIEQRVRSSVGAAGLADAVGFRREDRGFVVTIATDQVMFEPGEADIQTSGATILREVAAALREVPNQVVVEGHTDTVPISTSRYRSNWELSTARATEVLRSLVDELGLPAERVSAAGYGEQRPIASNGDPAGRTQNRRVELAVLSLAATR
ncbi:MAG: OmpA family protein [Acidimicrobiia bacterium]